MNELQRKAVIAILALTGILTVIFTKIWTRIPIKRPLDCVEIGLRNLSPSTGDAVCETRIYLFGKYIVAHFAKRPVPGALQFSITGAQRNFSISGQLIKPPAGKFFVADMAGNPVWTSSGTGTDWSAGTRDKIVFPDTANQFMLIANTELPYDLVFTPMNDQPLRSMILSVTTGVIVCLLLFLFVSTPANTMVRWAIISSCMSLIILWYGMPFGSSTGWFDSGDDTSYMHWAYSLGYLWDPDLTHSSFIHSWALDHNHHSWGTGLVLMPFLIPARLISHGMQPGTIPFGLMNLGVITCGILAVFILFKAFSLFSPWRSALVMSLLALTSTSIMKWLFMRNIFSHVPEFLTLSMVLYFSVQRYFKQLQGRVYFIGLLFSLMLMTQVRRENIAFFAVIVAYEWMHIQATDKVARLKNISVVGLTAGLSIVILMGTNYFTKLKTFFGNFQTQTEFHSSNFLEVFLKQGPDVLYLDAYGLFNWKNAYPWLALAACIVYLRSWRWWLPLAGVAVLYLMMSTFHLYPNGFEWQNRFLLKLSPMLFAGALLFLNRVPLTPRIFGWAWMIAAAAMELNAYSHQLPKRMNFYISDFSDHTLMYPQRWPGTWMSIFYLPLIFSFAASFLAWTFVYFKRCDRSRDDVESAKRDVALPSLFESLDDSIAKQ